MKCKVCNEEVVELNENDECYPCEVKLAQQDNKENGRWEGE